MSTENLTTHPHQSFDVTIVGAGVVGLCASLAMHQLGYSVALLDAGPIPLNSKRPATPDQDPRHARVYALNAASQQLLQNLHVWQRIQDSDCALYQTMQVWDAANGAALDFDASMIGKNQLGVIISDASLKHALYQEIDHQGIHCFPKTNISNLKSTNDGVILYGQHGASWITKLLIASDGPRSNLRRYLKVDTTTWSYHQDAIVATVRNEKPHKSTAYQVFSPDSILAFLPLPSPQYASIVWSTSSEHAARLMALPENKFETKLKKTFLDILGETHLVGQRHTFPLAMRHVQEYSGERWLLMGDAAHTFHPLAGLGLNVGLADLTTWLELFNPKRGLTHQKALRAYQRQRKHSVWSTILLMQSLKSIFGSTTSPIVTLRGMGLTQCNRLSPLKRLFIQHAVGVDLAVVC